MKILAVPNKIHTGKNPTNRNEISLLYYPMNSKGIVKSIIAGNRATQRLSGMGITPGTIVEKITQAPFRGPIQISVRGTRLAIGRGLARKILIQKNS